MKVLILDDQRQSQFRERLSSVGLNDVTYVKTAKECIESLSAEQYDLIFLDYDLTYMEIENPSDENNGMAVVRWLKDHQMNANHNANIVIHSVDPYSSQHMKEFLPNAIVMPGAWIESQFNALVEKLKLQKDRQNSEK